MIIGAGGGSAETYTPREDPNTLQSMQEVTIIDAISEGQIVGFATGDEKSIAFNETPLKINGAYSFKNIEWALTDGSADNGGAANNVATNTEREVAVNTEVTKWIPKGDSSGADGSVTRTVNNQYMTDIRITMSVQGLYRQTDEGDLVGAFLSYTVRIYNNESSLIVNDTVSKNDKTTSSAQWEKIYKVDGKAPYRVVITKNHNDSTSSKLHDDIYWTSYTEIIGYPMIYPHTAYAKIKGNAETFSNQIPSRAYKIKGIILEVPSNYDPVTRQYTGIWDGTFKKAWSDNPAWVLRDILENGRYGLKRFFPPTKQSQALCDKWSLYAIAQYCDALVSNGSGGQEPRYTFNGQIMGSEKATQVVQSIASNFHGMTYWGSGMIMATSDIPKDPIKSLTQANIIDGTFTYATGSAEERHSVALVTWYDQSDYGKERIEPVYDWDAYQQYGYRAIELTAYGCTSRAQAYRHGLWTLLTEQEQWQATCEMGLDGYDLMPGDFVKIADPNWMGTRYSGRIKSISGCNITLDGEVTFSEGETYKLYIVMPNGKEQSRTITNSAGTYTTVTVSEAFTQAPVAYAVWTISGTDVAPRTFAIKAIKEKAKGRVELTLREVLAAKYAKLEQEIIFTDTPGRKPSAGIISPPSGLTVVASEFINNGNVTTRLTFSWVASGDGLVTIYEWGYKTPASSEWVYAEQTKAYSADILSSVAGIHQFRVRAFALDGRYSEWATINYETTAPTLIPPMPTNVVATGGEKSIKLNWTMPSSSLIGYFEIWQATLPDFETAQLQAKIYASSFDFINLTSLQTYYYWLRSVSYANESCKSAFTTMVSATTSAPEFPEIKEASIDKSKLALDIQGNIDNIEEIGKVIQSLDASVSEWTDRIVAENNNAHASFTKEIKLAVNQTEAVAQSVETLEAKVDGEIAAAITTLSTAIAKVDGSVEAKYYVRVNAKNKVVGFGLGTNGETSEFAIVVDKFLIAKADGTSAPVFEINSETGNVQIIGDLIASGSITGDKINARSQIQIGETILIDGTNNQFIAKNTSFKIYKQGQTASEAIPVFTVDADGNLVLAGSIYVGATSIKDGAITTNKLAAGAITTDKLAAGAVTADKITIGTASGARMVLTNNLLRVYDANDTLRVSLGVWE